MSTGKPSEDTIHDIASAAERAKVTPAVILRWIGEGLRATPVGRVGKRGPRDYRIFDSWLLEFLEARASRCTSLQEPGEHTEPSPGRRRSGGRKAKVAAGSPDGLWPKPFGSGDPK